MIFNRHAVIGWMEERLLSKSDLAVKSQLSTSYIGELLNGEKDNPSPKAIRQLAEALEIDPRNFYFRPTPEQLERVSSELAVA